MKADTRRVGLSSSLMRMAGEMEEKAGGLV